MAPPFIAYYAANTNNKTLLNIAVQQCADYRAVLKTSKGPWEHISATSHPDTGLWSTGNGWAAMGMARVLGTVVKSAFTDSVKNPLETELVGWVKEILDGAMATAVRP
jgi:rhamnogalacturonyl hydrolase YesR